MTIEFLCTACGQLLRRPEDKAGKQANCPECGETLTIPSVESDSDPSDSDPPSDEGDTKVAAKTRLVYVTCPMCGQETPAGRDSCQSCGEAMTDPRRRIAPFHASETVTVALTLAKQKFWSITGGWLICGFMMSTTYIFGTAAHYAIMHWLQNAYGAQFQTERDLVRYYGNLSFAGVVLLESCVAIWLLLGLLTYLLNLARGTDARLSNLFSATRFVLRGLLSVALFSLMMWIGLYLYFVPAVIVLVVFFPFLYLVIDVYSPGISSLTMSVGVTEGNRLGILWICFVMYGVFLLTLIPRAAGQSLMQQMGGASSLTIALLINYVAVSVLMPILLMLPTVTYLHLTGQRTVADRT